MAEWDKSEIIGFLRYGYWLNTLNSIAYGRIDFAFNFTQLMIGSGVVASISGDIKSLSVTLAFLAAGLSIAAALLSFGVKRVEFKYAAAEYNDLLVDIETMEKEAAYRRLTKLQSAFPRGFDFADKLAHNCVCEMHDQPDSKNELTRFERAVAKILFGQA